MVRVALTAYLTLAASLGPGLCWCTPLWAMSQSCHNVQSPAQEKKPHSHAGCHGHGYSQHSHHEEANEPQSQSNQSPCPNEGPSCPCDHHRAIPVALLVSDGGFRTQAIELGPSFDSMPVLDFSQAAIIVSASDFSERFHHSLSTPYASGREILRALHILRC